MSLATQDFWIRGNKLELTEFSSDHDCALGIKVQREDSVGIVLEECRTLWGEHEQVVWSICVA